MLTTLYIQNYVLIDRLNISFDKSFSVVTGETGAGKSIILGALGLVLGQRADAKSIKSGADKCVIEADFDISAYHLDSIFHAYDMEYDPKQCILRRELYASGKSRAFVNDSPVSLAAMRALGDQLIDIHSQHQNLLLADNKFQLKVIDIMAGLEIPLKEYQTVFQEYRRLKKELKEWEEKALNAKKEEDYIRFQLEQLEDANLIPSEQDDLEQESETLTHAEEIKGALYKINTLLDGEEQSGLSFIREALSTSDSLERYFSKAKEFTERLRSAYIDLKDLASQMESLQDEVEFNPERLEWVNERIHQIYTLQQKHMLSSVEELIELRDRYRSRLEQIDSFDDQIAVLRSQLEEKYQGLLKLASGLTAKRRAAADKVAKQLVLSVVPLGMPNTRFRIDFLLKKEPDVDGMDEIRFMFSANKSGELERVEQIASGGEISRLMLCIKAMIAGCTSLPAIIFDEVDTGVSGEIADKMGNIMKELGNHMQVMAITHLPQIASKGNEHYYVYKEDRGHQTVTSIRALSGDERVREVARMLSGASLTEASIANAKELLGQ